MFKNALLPTLIAAIVVGTAAVAWHLYLNASDGRQRREDVVIPSRLTYDEARVKLLRNSHWHITESPPSVCCWVTRQPRQARELKDVILVEDRDDPKRDRRGIVRVQPARGQGATICLDEDDTSYWRVVGNVHLAGDPTLVREVTAFLVDGTEP
jgi:hypothetical protein